MSRKENSKNKNSSKKRQNKNSKQKRSMNEMKYEIANEFGVDLGPEVSSRCNDKLKEGMTRSSKKKSK